MAQWVHGTMKCRHGAETPQKSQREGLSWSESRQDLAKDHVPDPCQVRLDWTAQGRGQQPSDTHSGSDLVQQQQEKEQACRVS